MESIYTNVSQDKKNFAAIVHGAGMFFGFIPSLIMYFAKQDDPYFKKQSIEALNYQITVFFLMMISSVLTVVVIGIFFLIIVGFSNFILCIVAAVKVSKGRDYRYPLTFRILKYEPNNPEQEKTLHTDVKKSGRMEKSIALFCHSCGQSMENGNLFCTGCGAKQ